jgi:hypothetical protein
MGADDTSIAQGMVREVSDNKCRVRFAEGRIKGQVELDADGHLVRLMHSFKHFTSSIPSEMS